MGLIELTALLLNFKFRALQGLDTLIKSFYV